jgi:peptidoglycan hydrolase CwlO-like protein
MQQIWLWVGAVGAGFVLGFVVRSISLWRLQRTLNSTKGYLDSEKLMKEKFQKENHALQQIHAIKENELKEKILQLQRQLREMDDDLVLLQKDNEETEKLMRATQPEIHELKVKLLEANNTIARYKALLQQNNLMK